MRDHSRCLHVTSQRYQYRTHRIVLIVSHAGIEAEDRMRTFMADAEEYARRGSVATARAIYAHAAAQFPGEPAVWRAAAALEKAHGSREALDLLLQKAVRYCPQAEVRGAGGRRFCLKPFGVSSEAASAVDVPTCPIVPAINHAPRPPTGSVADGGKRKMAGRGRFCRRKQHIVPYKANRKPCFGCRRCCG